MINTPLSLVAAGLKYWDNFVSIKLPAVLLSLMLLMSSSSIEAVHIHKPEQVKHVPACPLHGLYIPKQTVTPIFGPSFEIGSVLPEGVQARLVCSLEKVSVNNFGRIFLMMVVTYLKGWQVSRLRKS